MKPLKYVNAGRQSWSNLGLIDMFKFITLKYSLERSLNGTTFFKTKFAPESVTPKINLFKIEVKIHL